MKLVFFPICLLGLIIFSLLCTSCIENVTNPILPPKLYSQPAGDSLSGAAFIFNPTDNPKKMKRGFQGVPSIGYKDGILYASWMCGVKAEEPGGYLTVVTSNDMGATWSKDELLIVPTLDSARHVDTSFWTDPTGELHLSWTYIKDGMWDGGIGGLWHFRIKKEGNKLVITKPLQLGNGVMNVKPCKLASDTTVMYLPIYAYNYWDAYYGGHRFYKTLSEFNAPFIYKLKYDNNLKHLLPLQQLVKIPTNYSRTFDEHMVVDLTNNNFLAFFRSNDKGIVYSKSSDSGMTWTPQQQFTDLGVNPSSRFFCSRLKSGNLLFVLNNSPDRKNMTAYLSKDNGKTWPYKLVLDARSNSYPDAVQLPDGKIAIIYDRGRVSLGQILLTIVSEQEIVNGDNSKIRIITISQLN